MRKNDNIWLSVHIRSRSEKAIQVDNGHLKAWIPKAAIVDYEDDLEVGTHTKIEIPEWLALEKDLI
jgi:hypothetical protein